MVPIFHHLIIFHLDFHTNISLCSQQAIYKLQEIFPAACPHPKPTSTIVVHCATTAVQGDITSIGWAASTRRFGFSALFGSTFVLFLCLLNSGEVDIFCVMTHENALGFFIYMQITSLRHYKKKLVVHFLNIHLIILFFISQVTPIPYILNLNSLHHHCNLSCHLHRHKVWISGFHFFQLLFLMNGEVKFAFHENMLRFPKQL